MKTKYCYLRTIDKLSKNQTKYIRKDFLPWRFVVFRRAIGVLRRAVAAAAATAALAAEHAAKDALQQIHLPADDVADGALSAAVSRDVDRLAALHLAPAVTAASGGRQKDHYDAQRRC